MKRNVVGPRPSAGARVEQLTGTGPAGAPADAAAGPVG
jgi:hypothetical protein